MHSVMHVQLPILLHSGNDIVYPEVGRDWCKLRRTSLVSFRLSTVASSPPHHCKTVLVCGHDYEHNSK